MRRLSQPARIPSSPLRRAIRRLFARPFLAGSILLALAPAGHSLTLGDISVRSKLGQRLDATIPVRLGAGESLATGCVIPSRQTSDLRTVPAADVTTPETTGEGLHELRVTSASALYEPMYELELKVQCPGAPLLVRQYVLMLDLPASVATDVAATLEPAVAPRPATPAEVPGAPDDRATGLTAGPPGAQQRAPARVSGETIAAGVRYRVAEGDTLSSIASRVRSRTVSLWALAGAIQAANPEAFIRNDANLIKLGSEILIPDTTATVTAVGASSAAAESQKAPPPLPVPEPVVAPVLAMEPPVAPKAAPQAAPVAELAMAPMTPPEVAAAPQAAAPPAALPAPVPSPRSSPEPTAPAVAAVDEPNPVFAAGAGILFGLCISLLLWVRGSRPSRKQLAAKSAPDESSRSPIATTALATAMTTAPAPLVTRSLEPAFSVSYTPPADDSLAAEFASADVTSELEELFDSTDTTIQKRLNAEKTMAALSLNSDGRASDGLGEDAEGYAVQDEYASVGVPSGRAVDFLVGDPTDADSTRESGTVDMNTLVAAATKDQQQAQNLLEALTLLERDYEEELTASQVLDMSAVRQALGSDRDEPTQIRDTQIREAGARKRAR